MSLLTRTLRFGDEGLDVFAVKRATHRLLQTGKLDELEAKSVGERERFGAAFQTLVKIAQQKHKLAVDGVVGPLFEKLLVREQAIDARSAKLLADYAHAHPPKPILVQPRQGWDSLHRSLWELYSIGRGMGLSDLGTYNPRSVLPGSRRPSDHASCDGVHIRPPAIAFDLGIEPDTGWANPVGRAFFLRCVNRPEVNYVILGDRIWSRSRGLHAYTSGGHMNHAHVSGVRP